MYTIIFDWKRTLYDAESKKLIDGALNILKFLTTKWSKVILIGKGGDEMYQEVKRLKVEEYFSTPVVVHRKGATRAFPDQPVLIPGSMGTASYVLVGTEASFKESFGSSCHGAGRTMSRTKAKKIVRGSVLKEELEKRGISVRSGSMAGLAEEAPMAYKDVEEVVNVVQQVGIAKKVARLKPIGVIKG